MSERLDPEVTNATLRAGEAMEQERATAQVACFLIRLPFYLAEGVVKGIETALNKLGHALSQGDTR